MTTDTPIGYGQVITALAKAEPDRVAIFIEDEPYTIGALERRANQMARVFDSLGVSEGNIVTISLPNSIELLVAMLATWKIGAIPNPISSSMPMAEAQHIIASAKSALVIGLESSEVNSTLSFKTLSRNFEPDKTLSESPFPVPTQIGAERALASGGSSGKPKLIIPEAKAVYSSATASPLFKPKHAVLVPGPLYHAVPFSSTWQGLFSGSTVVIMKRFCPSRCLELIERHQVDRLSVVPTMMLRIWRLPKAERLQRDVSSLAFVMSGGAPLPAWLMRAWIEWLGPEVMHEAFGPSERIGGTFITGTEWLAHPGSVGKPMPTCDIKILDDSAEECSSGVMGEIYMMPKTGSGSTYRYLGAKGNVAADGWESVGDMGYLDDDGYLYLGDRRSDMILSGGRNIYPAEIEAAIEEHPSVRSCVVIGLPCEDMGQTIYAIVDHLSAIDDDVLKSFLKDKLTGYKIPSTFEYVNTLLRNDAGKVRRSAYRDARIGSKL